MATLYIAEYSALPNVPGGVPQIAPEPSLRDQTVAISGTSAQSTAFGGDTRYIAVSCDGIWSRKVGGNPTALTTSFRLAADVIMFYSVQPGDKIAGITNT